MRRNDLIAKDTVTSGQCGVLGYTNLSVALKVAADDPGVRVPNPSIPQEGARRLFVCPKFFAQDRRPLDVGNINNVQLIDK